MLLTEKIESESESHLKPLVERTVHLFGDPIATVRDLGEGGKKAVAPLRKRGVLDLECHYQGAFPSCGHTGLNTALT